MNKILTIVVSLIAINLCFAFGKNNSMCMIPILEIPGEKMPGWETQVIELYGDESGNSMPVIFRGGAKDWEAASWTPEYFAEHFGDEEIAVMPQKGPEEDLSNDEKSKKLFLKFINTIMRDHINDILINPKNACYFVGVLNYNETKKDLIKDNEEKNVEDEDKDNDDVIVIDEEGKESKNFLKNSLFVHTHLDLESQTLFPQSIIKKGEEGRSYNLLIGSSNTITSLHNHGSTFLAQMYGRKLATLVHPKDSGKCGCVFKRSENVEVFHCADILNPDFEKYPELKKVEVYQTILEPGDVLYIPEGWLHDIRGLSTSINVASGF